MLSDLRFAIRLLLKDRSFALTALLTLAVTIGANTAIFSIVRSVLLKPLPVPESDRIVLRLQQLPERGRAAGRGRGAGLLRSPAGDGRCSRSRRCSGGRG